MDKILIRERFAKAAGTYDENAEVQRHIAGRLNSLICSLWPSAGDCRSPGRVLEVGCGTGFLTRAFLSEFTPDRMWLNDLCPEVMLRMNDLKSGGVSFLPGDAETEDFPSGLDLIMSSSAVQWFEDFPAFVRKCHSALSENGMLAFSTFGPDNLKEIAALTGVSMPVPGLGVLRETLSEYFDVVHFEEESCRTKFSSPYEVLVHLKSTGVNGLKREPWTRSRLNDFCRRYEESFSDGGSVCLTYHPIYMVCRKLDYPRCQF